MISSFFCIIFLVFTNFCCAVQDDSYTTIIPQERLIDWSRAGLLENGVKGIPNRTIVFCNVRVNIPGSTLIARGDGIQDDTAALQAAINACPAGQVVLVPQGVYLISGTLRLSKGIVVRGEGPDKTRIIQSVPKELFRVEGTSTGWWAAGHSESESNIVKWVTSGHSKGSDTVEITNSTYFDVGDVVYIDQLNDPDLVTPNGSGGTCTWCGMGNNGSRAMAETLIIKAKNGNKIQFNRPLSYNYRSQYKPRLIVLSEGPVRYAGIEKLYIESASGNSDGDGIVMTYCVNSWVKGVESKGIAGKSVTLWVASYGNEVRECYFHHAQYFDGNRGYGVSISSAATDNLIEDNIFYFLHAPIIIGSSGGTGNVIGYNYIERTQMEGNNNWFSYHMGAHGAHTYMNLFEGNVCGKVMLDGYWGSGSHNVFFRNHITRENGTPVTQVVIAADIEALNYYVTFVGNILGKPGCTGVVEQIPYVSFENNPVLWRIGFKYLSDRNPVDPKVAQTLLKTGNWECVTNAVQWTTSVRTIPDSLYLPSKPEWFGILAWPPFAPERQDFNPNSLNKIPAQIRFENGPAMGLRYPPPQGY